MVGYLSLVACVSFHFLSTVAVSVPPVNREVLDVRLQLVLMEVAL